MDISEQKKMYEDFLKLIKYSSIGTALVLIAMAATLL